MKPFENQLHSFFSCVGICSDCTGSELDVNCLSGARLGNSEWFQCPACEEQQTGWSAGCWGGSRSLMKAFERHWWVVRCHRGEWAGRNIWKWNMLGIFRCDIKGGKGALGEKLVLKRLHTLVSEMGSEPEDRSCGRRLERLEHVQNKQIKLTWDVEFGTKGSSSCWKTSCDV